MLRLGIIGFPLEHSLSPLMHTTALQNLNIVGEYKAYEIKEDNFEKKVKQLIASGLHGFNVTIPYKTRIIPLLDKLTKEAELAQAVNTVTIDKTGITTGSNTDITGFFEAIPEDIRKKIKETNVVVLGNGGAARAVCIAFLLNGIKRIKIYGRSKEKLERFKEFLTDRKNKLRTNTNIEVETCHGMSLPDNVKILVNTTPLGMYPNTDKSPVSIDDLKKLPKDALVYDIIYNPLETKLLKDAKSLNLKTLNGLEMFIRQGAESLGIWLKQDPPLGAMRLSVESCHGMSLRGN